MSDFPQGAVDGALKRLGRYRVMAAQEIAAEGAPDEFSGATLLALGLRESGLQNINNPAETDHGCFQVSELFHAEWLTQQPGCPAGTWTISPGHSALEDGYCPRFTPACLYALRLLKMGADYARAKVGIDNQSVRLAFALASYNAGIGGALRGYREGDVDKFTTGGDYSAWVIVHRTKVNHFLSAHEGWRP